ncbi:hypothetical protein AG1IA_07424 [Rhizoctonia solani AG-1 IA]|uniref:Uncharacterized protein n=1 Tax=Thanatephorus cucumeris (strain AG1-IA) TaxID=983506 RepID=L8WP55_THACA|nr:hypothetical protein AG1IA_07424 [Rhizoctonia solani AG-1 IA]
MGIAVRASSRFHLYTSRFPPVMRPADQDCTRTASRFHFTPMHVCIIVLRSTALFGPITHQSSTARRPAWYSISLVLYVNAQINQRLGSFMCIGCLRARTATSATVRHWAYTEHRRRPGSIACIPRVPSPRKGEKKKKRERSIHPGRHHFRRAQPRCRVIDKRSGDCLRGTYGAGNPVGQSAMSSKCDLFLCSFSSLSPRKSLGKLEIMCFPGGAALRPMFGVNPIVHKRVQTKHKGTIRSGIGRLLYKLHYIMHGEFFAMGPAIMHGHPYDISPIQAHCLREFPPPSVLDLQLAVVCSLLAPSQLLVGDGKCTGMAIDTTETLHHSFSQG